MMFKAVSVWFLVVLVCTGTLSAQNRNQNNQRENIAILPFTGGASGEGDTIAEIFSYSPSLSNYFGIIPRTTIANAVSREQSFQMSSGMTNADTIAALGAQLGAKYVMAGSITALGSQKILVVTIIKIESIEQVAGAYATYTGEEELPSKVETLVKNILPMISGNRNNLPKLAIVPVVMQQGSDPRTADTLAQILSISLLGIGEYAIYPRTSSLEQVQQEYQTQLSGITADNQAAKVGYGVNPEYVLSVVTRKLGTMTMFNASIIDLESGTQKTGISQQYTAIEDGMNAMDIIAKAISGQETDTARERYVIEQSERARTEAKEQEEWEQQERDAKAKAKRDAKTDVFLKNSGIRIALEGGISSGGGNVAFKIGPYWKWFSLETGTQLNIKYKADAEDLNHKDIEEATITYSFLQIPVLLRVGTLDTPMFPWSIGRFPWSIGIFAGAGFNIPLSATLNVPMMSWIVGGEFGFHVGSLSLLFQLQGVFDTGKASIVFADHSSYEFSHSPVEGKGSIRFVLPFRKTPR